MADKFGTAFSGLEKKHIARRQTGGSFCKFLAGYSRPYFRWPGSSGAFFIFTIRKKLQRSLLVYYIHRTDADVKVSRKSLKEVDKLEDLQTGKSIQLSENMELMRDREYFKLVANSRESQNSFILHEKDIKVSGITLNALQFKIQTFKKPDFLRFLYLDWDAMAWPLHLRQWKKVTGFNLLE